MPTAGEYGPHLIDVSVAEVAEALEVPLPDQLCVRIDTDVLVIYSITAARRAVGVLMFRHDDSFVWWVARARPMNDIEFEQWLARLDRHGGSPS